jgi:transposase
MTELREGIIRLHLQGWKCSKIAKEMDLPYMTVSDAIKRYQGTGDNKDD